MLHETKKSVVAVALDVGYTNPSHFAKLFRRETGLSPNESVGSVDFRFAADSSNPNPFSGNRSRFCADSRAFFCCAPIRGFEQYRDRLSKNTCDDQTHAK